MTSARILAVSGLVALRALRTVMCSPPGPTRDAAEAMLAESSLFEVIAHIEDGRDIAEKCRAYSPEVLVLDDALAGVDVRRLARTLALERPLPTLLLVDDEPKLSADEEELNRSLRLYRMAKRRLVATDAVGRANTRTRLRLLATRSMEAKRTLPRENLMGIVDELRQELGVEVSPDIETLARLALDLVVFVVDGLAAQELVRIITTAPPSRVPLLVVMPDNMSRRLEERGREQGLRVTTLDNPTALRRVNGVLLASGRRTWVDGDVLRVDTKADSDHAALIESLASAKGAALPIVATESRSESRALRAVAASTGRAVRWGVSSFDEGGVVTMSSEELPWFLQNVIPRRI